MIAYLAHFRSVSSFYHNDQKKGTQTYIPKGTRTEMSGSKTQLIKCKSIISDHEISTLTIFIRNFHSRKITQLVK